MLNMNDCLISLFQASQDVRKPVYFQQIYVLLLWQ